MSFGIVDNATVEELLRERIPQYWLFTFGITGFEKDDR